MTHQIPQLKKEGIINKMFPDDLKPSRCSVNDRNVYYRSLFHCKYVATHKVCAYAFHFDYP